MFCPDVDKSSWEKWFVRLLCFGDSCPTVEVVGQAIAHPFIDEENIRGWAQCSVFDL